MIKYIVPITCYIVNQCKGVEGENTVFEYNHLKFNQVCLVGLIRNVIKRANDVTYLIDDMTSRELVSVKLQADVKIIIYYNKIKTQFNIVNYRNRTIWRRKK